jgi:hypothetical protein
VKSEGRGTGLSERVIIETVGEALDVLEDAIISQGFGQTPQRVRTTDLLFCEHQELPPLQIHYYWLVRIPAKPVTWRSMGVAREASSGQWQHFVVSVCEGVLVEPSCYLCIL